MPSTPPAVTAALKAAAIAARKFNRSRGSNQVIRKDRALACCEKVQARTLGRIQAALNGILDASTKVRQGGGIGYLAGLPALVPNAVRVLSPAEVAQMLKVLPPAGAAAGGAAAGGGAAAAAAALLPATVLLITYAELAPLIETRGFYEAMSIVGNVLGVELATQTKRRDRGSECASCMDENSLPQTHKRKRIRTKILRRL